MRSKFMTALAAGALVMAAPAFAQSSDADFEDEYGLSRSAGIGIFGSIVALSILFIFLEVLDDGDGGDDDGPDPVSP